MSWLLIIILVYILLGAFLVERTMRGAEIRASITEWCVLLLLWPLCLKFLLHFALMQARFEAVEVWAENEWKNVQD